jgi:hypothetical protein
MSLWKLINGPIKDGTPVVYLAKYVLNWKKEFGLPDVAFVESEDYTADVDVDENKTDSATAFRYKNKSNIDLESEVNYIKGYIDQWIVIEERSEYGHDLIVLKHLKEHIDKLVEALGLAEGSKGACQEKNEA